MRKVETIIVAVFAITGVILLGAAVWMGSASARFSGSAMHATGTVIELIEKESSSHVTTWYPVIRFTTADEHIITFESGTGSNPSMYRQGQEVEILYDPADPLHPRLNSLMELWFAPAFFCFIGMIFSAVGFGIGFMRLAKKNKENWLLSHGMRIQATVKQVSLDRDISENGMSPYIIIAQYTDKDTNKIYIFESESIWYDPVEFVGESVTVLVDPANYKKYYVDLSFLPQKQ